jgi:membrane-associated protein
MESFVHLDSVDIVSLHAALSHQFSVSGFLNPGSLIRHLGPFALLGVCAIIFAETGLLIGFVFPGDTLLIILGLLSDRQGNHDLGIAIWLAAPAIALAAFLGGEMGYFIGNRFGPRVFERRESGLFSRAQVVRTNRFFDKYGPLAVILGRFVPIVRTFLPIAAGIGHMTHRRYVTYNAVGAIAWGGGVTLLGWAIGFIPPIAHFVRNYIDVILLAAVVVSLGPTLFHIWRNSQKAKKLNAEAPQPD